MPKLDFIVGAKSCPGGASKLKPGSFITQTGQSHGPDGGRKLQTIGHQLCVCLSVRLSVCVLGAKDSIMAFKSHTDGGAPIQHHACVAPFSRSAIYYYLASGVKRSKRGAGCGDSQLAGQEQKIDWMEGGGRECAKKKKKKKKEKKKRRKTN